MPINPTVRQLARDGRFTLQDAQKLKQAVDAGTVSANEAKETLNRYAEAMDQDAAALLGDAFQTSGRPKQTSFPEGFTDKTLKRGQQNEDVRTLQRGLMSAGVETANVGMALGAGADGIFGPETQRSVKAFQKANGIPETGIADPATLKALQQAMAGATPTASRPLTPAVTPPAQQVRPSTGLQRREPAAPAAAAPAAAAPPPAAAAAAPAAAAAATPTPRPAATPTAPAATPTAPAARPTPPAPTATAPAAAAAAGAAVATPASTPTAPAQTPAPATRTGKPVPQLIGEGVKPATPDAVVSVARNLAEGERAKNYGTVNPWKNTDPNHAAPVDVSMGGLKDRWKCNLFGGNTLAAAGFEPPYYGNRGKGEYPVAEDWHKWSKPTPEAQARAQAEGRTIPDYAGKSRNQSRFDLQDEVQIKQMDPVSTDPSTPVTPEAQQAADTAKRQRIQEFLDRVQPGDVVTADHVGKGSDGGHVRVCVGRDPVTNLPLFAQAKSDQARVVAEGPDAFMREEAIYILRPNTPRKPAAPNS
jgi:peptidoglycan hydrolase-like protein with peptidoglycan-binding domain